MICDLLLALTFSGTSTKAMFSAFGASRCLTRCLFIGLRTDDVTSSASDQPALSRTSPRGGCPRCHSVHHQGYAGNLITTCIFGHRGRHWPTARHCTSSTAAIPLFQAWDITDDGRSAEPRGSGASGMRCGHLFRNVLREAG